MTTVVSVHDMDDETFKMHANKRHAGDFKAPFTDVDKSEEVMGVARAAHDFFHRDQLGLIKHDHLEE